MNTATKIETGSISASTPTPTRLLEVCIDNVASGIEAEKGGAGRIELCSSLAEGGLTPSVGFLKIIKSLVKIPIFVMIRPRGGDFLYSKTETEIMKEDIRILKGNGADGFVFGILNKDGSIDEAHCLELLDAASPLPVTFHRAFDLIPDPELGLETIIRLGFQRILTSGQSNSALNGVQVIRRLVDKAKNRILIMAGAGVTPANLKTIIDTSRPPEVHASCRGKIVSKMELGKTSTASMGSTEDEMNIYVTDSNMVRSIVQQLL